MSEDTGHYYADDMYFSRKTDALMYGEKMAATYTKKVVHVYELTDEEYTNRQVPLPPGKYQVIESFQPQKTSLDDALREIFEEYVGETTPEVEDLIDISSPCTTGIDDIIRDNFEFVHPLNQIDADDLFEVDYNGVSSDIEYWVGTLGVKDDIIVLSESEYEEMIEEIIEVVKNHRG
jgi:hypothetical protein